MKIKHILIIMDPTIDEQPALAKAIEIAKRFKAKIELFLVVYHSALVPKWFNQEHPNEQIITNYLKTKQRWLDTYLSLAKSENIPVSSEVRWHKPLYAEMLKKITECHPDLVVKSTHMHPMINRLLFTPNDWQLLKSCPVPLLLAKQSTSGTYKNILAAVDLEKDDDESEGLDKVLLDVNALISAYFDAAAHVIHAYDPMGHELWPNNNIENLGVDLSSYHYLDYQNKLQEQHENEFNRLINHYAFNEENIHLVNGIVAYQLIDVIKDNNIDLLVMGIKYHSGFVGTTAEKILDEVNCDILAIKPQT